ncbi:MAG: glycosyltransferase [Candidatus Altiarchaeales archaeon]|nr:glycosyltransferase [Candidatus Altiarchaeales archaeon]
MSFDSVSVVVPAYNEEKCLGSTLQSLRNQIQPISELIVVDNNSVDATVEVAEKFADKVLTEKNQGEAYARQRGVEEASSRFIVSCDSDTIYPWDHVQKIVETLNQEGVAGVHGYLDVGDKAFNAVYHYFVLLNRLWGFPQVGASNMAFKKKYFQGFKIRYPHSFDILLSKHLMKQGELIYRPDLKVRVSNRRLEENIFQAVKDHSKNYFGLLLLGKPMMTMTDIR